jgi:RNA dependent RNA polymerase
MIMVLEDRGVRKEAFIDLQDAAKAEIYLSEDSLTNFGRLLKSHSLGNKFHLSFILEQLHLLGLDLQNKADKELSKAFSFNVCYVVLWFTSSVRSNLRRGYQFRTATS